LIFRNALLRAFGTLCADEYRGVQMNNVLIVNGNPDPRPERFSAALCEAYRTGAARGGLSTRMFAIGDLATPSKSAEPAASSFALAMDAFRWAERLFIVFPLWLDQPPTMLKAFFEQNSPLLAQFQSDRRSTRVRSVVTMDMPAFAHRASFRKSDRTGMAKLALPGVDIGEPLFIGSVRTLMPERRSQWLRELHAFGARCG
jgi:putative NADPH-quinone reductase